MSLKSEKQATFAKAIKLVPKVIEQIRWGHGPAISQSMEALIEVISDSFPVEAKKIQMQLVQHQSIQPRNLPIKPERLLDFGQAKFGLDAMVLPKEVVEICQSIIAEHSRKEELAKYQLAPRHKALVYGPPGNGKTMLAQAMAFELDVPFLTVKYSSLIAGHLGETGKQLQEVMDYAKNGPCVLFFDEFDAIAMERGHGQDVGEMRRITNQVLIALDRLPPSCMFIAATNANRLLDKAVHRRFDLTLEIPKPSREIVLELAKKELDPSITGEVNVLHLAHVIAGKEQENLSHVVNLCQRIRRDMVLCDGINIKSIASGPEVPETCITEGG